MTDRLLAFFGVVVASIVAGSVLAQDRLAQPREMMPRPEFQAPGSMMSDAPGTQMPGADPFHLLQNSVEVQEDLGLNKDQLARLNRASRNFRTRLQELSNPASSVSHENARIEIESHIQDTRGMIARELTPNQLARLQQIMLQLEGPCLANIDRLVSQQLGLTIQQNQALSNACQARSKQMQQTFQSPGAGDNFCTAMAINRARVEQVRSRADGEILKLLEPAQKAALLRMSGKKLHLTPPMPPECN